jgi:hypothetical protein
LQILGRYSLSRVNLIKILNFFGKIQQNVLYDKIERKIPDDVNREGLNP